MSCKLRLSEKRELGPVLPFPRLKQLPLCLFPPVPVSSGTNFPLVPRPHGERSPSQARIEPRTNRWWWHEGPRTSDLRIPRHVFQRHSKTSAAFLLHLPAINSSSLTKRPWMRLSRSTWGGSFDALVMKSERKPCRAAEMILNHQIVESLEAPRWKKGKKKAKRREEFMEERKTQGGREGGVGEFSNIWNQSAGGRGGSNGGRTAENGRKEKEQMKTDERMWVKRWPK